jgi:hypothetical protein
MSRLDVREFTRDRGPPASFMESLPAEQEVFLELMYYGHSISDGDFVEKGWTPITVLPSGENSRVAADDGPY